MLSSTVLQDVQNIEGTVVAYFYFDFNEKSKQFCTNLLRSLVAQVASQSRTLWAFLICLFRKCQDDARQPQDHELETLLATCIDLVTHEKIVLVLDALDECEDRDSLIEVLERLVAMSTTNLSVFMTSRRIKDFEDAFEDCLKRENTISIQDRIVDRDIRAYIRERLVKDRRFKRWRQSRNQKSALDEAESKLMEKSNGM